MDSDVRDDFDSRGERRRRRCLQEQRSSSLHITFLRSHLGPRKAHVPQRRRFQPGSQPVRAALRFDVVVDLASTLRLKGDDDDDDEDESSCSETCAKLLLFSVDVVWWCGAPLRVKAWISLPSFVDF